MELSLRLNRLVSFVASLSLLANSLLTPFSIAYAQEVTPTPEPTPIVEETSTPIPEPTETPVIIPTPEETVTPTPTVEETLTPTPEEAIVPTFAPESTPTAPAPPEVKSEQVEASSTSIPTATPEQPQENGHISAVVLSDTSAASIPVDDLTVNTDGSATLQTDKADYAPTDAVLVTGAGFLAGKTYKIIISSSDSPAVTHEGNVTADSGGKIIYSYQLDGNYRPNYKVEILSGGMVVATTTFTDTAPVQITVGPHEGEEGTNGVPNGSWVTGNVTTYREGDTIPFRIKLVGDPGTTGTFQTLFTHEDHSSSIGTCTFFVDTLVSQSTTGADFSGSLPAGVTITPSAISVVGPAGNNEGVITWTTTFGASVASNTEVGLIYNLKISDNAGECDGSSQHSNLDNATGSVKFQGNKNVPIPANQLIELPDITVIKRIDRDGNGNFESTALAGEFSFTLDGTTTLPIDSSGQAVFINVTPNGAHTLTETQLDFSQGTYDFVSGNGTNCTFNGSTATATVASGTTATDASCTFNNGLSTGTIVVHKDVQGPSGEDITDNSQNFTVRLNSVDPRTFTDGGTVTYSNVPSGPHTITETIIPLGYSFYSFSADSDTGTPGAQLSVTSGQTTEITVVNRQNNATITIHKNVINPDGSEVSDGYQFTVLRDGSDDKTIAEGTDAIYTVAPGQYTFTENPGTDYTLDLITGDNDSNAANGATLTVGPGGSAELTFVNKQKKATINVSKDVVKPDGQTDFSDNHAFTALLNGGTGQSFSEQTPTSYTVNPGQYTIIEGADDDYVNLGCKLVAGADAATLFNVPSNSTIYVTCKNAQKPATITVEKDVVKSDGSQVDDANTFSVTLNSETKDFGEGSPAVFSVDPGTYGATEAAETNYTLDSNDGPKTVGSNDSATIHIVNKQNPGSISGYKYDADGQTGLSNWTINLYTCSSGFLNCLFSLSATTAGDGSYNFSSLVTGFYQAAEELKTGWTNLTSLFHDITINPGTVSENNNFTNFEKVKVKACKVTDADGDIGTINDQSPRSGWTVYLLIDGQTNDTKTTGGNGCYEWTDLGPGHTYGVSEETPAGWTSLTDTTHSFGPAESGSEYVYTFVNFENAQIIVHKNVLGTDGTTDVSDTQEFTALLDSTNGKPVAEGADATYSDLGPGTYTVSEATEPGGYQLVSITDDGVVTVESGGIYDITITNKQVSATLIITKHVIINNRGNEDAGDFTINVTGTNVSLTGFPGEENGTTITLDAGIYSVNEDSVEGYTKSLSDDCSGEILFGERKYCTIINDDIGPTVTLIKEVRGGDARENDFGLTIGGQGVDSDQTLDVDANTPIELNEAGLDGYSFDSMTGEGCPSELGGTVTLDEGGSVICTIINTRDTGDISGYKFEDLNGNGNWDDGESGLEGWTIKLWTGQEDFVDSTETSDDPLGEYRFENIPTGEYAVCEVLQEGWQQTYPEGCHFFSLTEEGVQSLDFGNFKLASIGDFIWEDTDGDGIQDLGEPGIAGIDVNLYMNDGDGIFEPGGDDTFIGTETTDGTGGAYLFENLVAGAYWVDVVDSTLPAGYINTTSDPVGPIVLSSGEVYLLADVGYVPPIKEVKIAKSNNKSNTSAGDIVTYTLTVTTTGKVSFGNIKIKDVLPGGFSYMAGSTTINGLPSSDPTISGGVLEWTINDPELPLTITYKAIITTDLSAGTYKNLATCTAFVVRTEGSVDCNVADSSVSLGQGTSYGGNLTPQVLGAATELPATGSSTWILILAGLAGIFGVGLKIYGKKRYAKN